MPLRSSHCTQIVGRSQTGFWHMTRIVDAQTEVVKERVGEDKWRSQRGQREPCSQTFGECFSPKIYVVAFF